MVRRVLVFPLVFVILFAPGEVVFAGRQEVYNPVIEVPNLPISRSEAAVTRGMTQAHVRIIPVQSDTPQATIDEWMNEYSLLTFDEEHLKDSIEFRMNAAVDFINEALKNVQNNLHETRILNATDSR